jgi:hypothetical protein
MNPDPLVEIERKNNLWPPQTKPPTGIKPRIIADSYRALEIVAAIKRYVGKMNISQVPVEWVDELSEIIHRHQSKS